MDPVWPLIAAFVVAFYNWRTNAADMLPIGPILDVFDDLMDID